MTLSNTDEDIDFEMNEPVPKPKKISVKSFFKKKLSNNKIKSLRSEKENKLISSLKNIRNKIRSIKSSPVRSIPQKPELSESLNKGDDFF